MQDNRFARPVMSESYVAQVQPPEERNQGTPQGRASGKIFYYPVQYVPPVQIMKSPTQPISMKRLKLREHFR
jgi:hypothetical protein